MKRWMLAVSVCLGMIFLSVSAHALITYKYDPGNEITLVFIEEDPRYVVDVVDFGTTWVYSCYNSTLLNQDIKMQVFGNRDMAEKDMIYDSVRRFATQSQVCLNHSYPEGIAGKVFKFGNESTIYTFDEDEDASDCTKAGAWDALATCAKVIDEDESTFGQAQAGVANAQVWINYTLPLLANQDILWSETRWYVNDSYNSNGQNFTINDSCADFADSTGTLELWVFSDNDGVNATGWRCWNGAGSIDVNYNYGGKAWIAEESMYWAITDQGNYTIRIYDEATELPFNLNATNKTTLDIICETKRVSYNITSSNAYYNVTCAGENIEKLRLTMEFGTDSYFRTLQANTSSNSTDFYMVNLLNDSVVKVDFELNDLTADYIGGEGHIYRKLTNGTEEIISDIFNSENKLVAYLMQFAEYNVQIQSGSNVRSFGDILADAAGTKVLSVNVVEFGPDTTIAGSGIRVQFSTDNENIYFSYNDSLGETANVTFAVYNATNISQLLHFDDTVASAVTFSYKVPDVNQSYVAVYEFYHTTYGTRTGRTVISWQRDIIIEPLESYPQFYTLFGIIVCVILMFSFGPREAHVGAIFTAFAALWFWYIGWFEGYISSIAVIASIVIAFAGFLGRSSR